MGKKNKKLNLSRDDLYELYINQKLTSKEVGEKLNCSTKSVRNYLKKYDIPIRPNGEAVKLERSKWSKEKENARSLKYMETWGEKPLSVRKAIVENRCKYINTQSSIEKSRITKLKNHTSKTSKEEQKFYEKLVAIFGEEDVISQYSDKRYPFICDFYIKSKDLFIEY